MRRSELIASLPYGVRLKVPTRSTASYIAGLNSKGTWTVQRDPHEGWPAIGLGAVRDEGRARRMIAWWADHDLEVLAALERASPDLSDLDLSDLLLQCALQC